MKIYFLQRFLTNNPFCRSAYFNKLFMVPIGKTVVFKSFWLCTFLGNPVALFYVFSYHPFWEVFWTMVYDANGWNRLKTGFFGLNWHWEGTSICSFREKKNKRIKLKKIKSVAALKQFENAYIILEYQLTIERIRQCLSVIKTYCVGSWK